VNAPVTLEVSAATARPARPCTHTPHGPVETPAFMPVGTRATVKGVTPAQLAETGTQIVLANTYHLMLRPGADVVAHFGGLHQFMDWPHAILTDSGGFQLYSLADLRKITDNGVTFRSHIDGNLVEMTPESATQIQNQLGADIIMAFDECPPLPADRAGPAGCGGPHGRMGRPAAAPPINGTTRPCTASSRVAWTSPSAASASSAWSRSASTATR
jgi:queuine tRNA-ribosyltransferase